VREGDTLVVPKLDRLARSVPDAREIDDSLAARGIRLSLGGQVYDPADPMGKMFFNILATFAEFEVDLLRMRTREGMAVARAKGKLRGKQPKLSAKQQRELMRMYGTGEYTIADLAEVFAVSRTTVYRTPSEPRDQTRSVSRAGYLHVGTAPGVPGLDTEGRCAKLRRMRGLPAAGGPNGSWPGRGLERPCGASACGTQGVTDWATRVYAAGGELPFHVAQWTPRLGLLVPFIQQQARETLAARIVVDVGGEAPEVLRQVMMTATMVITPTGPDYYPCGGLSRTRLAAQIETGSLSRRMCAGLVGNVPGGCMVLYAFLGLVKRASRGTSTCALGLPQPVTGSHPGAAW
jgi:hypothetical protein